MTALDLILRETTRLLREKGEAIPPLSAASVCLDGSLPMDSLDLATLIVSLEKITGHDPFRAGLRQFTTLGELAALYAGVVAGIGDEGGNEGEGGAYAGATGTGAGS